jgi:hypothetical protein
MNTIMVKILLENLHLDAPQTVDYVRTLLEEAFKKEESRLYPRVKLILLEVTEDE